MANQFLQDLGASMQLFNQGVQQLGMQKAISQANDQVQQIRDSSLAEDEKQQAFRNLSQDMTMKFMQAGAPQAQIDQFQSAFSPKPTTIQTAEQAVLMGTPKQKEAGLGLINRQEQAKKDLELEKTDRAFGVAERKAEYAQGKEFRGTLSKTQADYNKYSKDILKAKQQADNALKLIDSGNPIAPNAVKTMLAKASGEVGNLTEAERDAFSGSQAIMDLLERYKTRALSSGFTPKDQQALRELAQVYSGSADQFQDNLANTLTGQLRANALFADQDEGQLKAKISGKKYVPPTEVAAPAPQGAAPAQQSAQGTPPPSATANPISKYRIR